MELLDRYFDTRQHILDYFGYKEDWVTIPLESFRENYWILDQQIDGSGHVLYHEQPLNENKITTGDFYSGRIYTQRFLPRWVYPGAEFTMICLNTQTDGNKYLAVFDNAKKQELTKDIPEAWNRWKTL